MWGNSRSTILLSSSPSIKGIRMSVISTSGLTWRSRGSAISPSPASPANSYPTWFHSTVSRSVSRMVLSSSTKKTRSINFCSFLPTAPPRYGNDAQKPLTNTDFSVKNRNAFEAIIGQLVSCVKILCRSGRGGKGTPQAMGTKETPGRGAGCFLRFSVCQEQNSGYPVPLPRSAIRR